MLYIFLIMQTKYHVAFNLGVKGKKYPRLSAIIEEFKNWLPKEIKEEAFRNSLVLVDNSFALETIVLDEEFFGLSFTRSDHFNPYLNYNVKIGLKNKNAEKEIDIKMSEENTSKIILPHKPLITRPRIVHSLLKNFGGYNDNNILVTKPINVNLNNVETCAEFIKSNERKYPVIYVSKPFDSEEFLVEPFKIAREIGGLGYTFFQEGDVEIPRILEKILGGKNSCYDGAVKIYWPNYEQSYNNLWLKKIVSEAINFDKKLLDLIAQNSVNIKGNTSFDDIKLLNSKKKTLEYKKKFEESENSRESKLFVDKLMEEYNDALILNEEIKQENDFLKSQLYENDLKISQLQLTIQEMQKLPLAEKEELTIKSPEQIMEVYNKVYTQSDVIIHPKAERMLKKLQYENPKLVYEVLEWLNEIYVPARKEGGNDLNELSYEMLKMEYNANQSDLVKKYDDYMIVHEGKKIFMEEHLKKGNSYDPKTTLRICFHYDENEEKVIVGYIGQHPKVGGAK
jgi:hypothetical protein